MSAGEYNGFLSNVKSSMLGTRSFIGRAVDVFLFVRVLRAMSAS
jgi:hypothetical protein